MAIVRKILGMKDGEAKTVLRVTDDVPTNGQVLKYNTTDNAYAPADDEVFDGAAIHDNVSGEVNALTEKTSSTNSDLILIEDSSNSFSKKKITLDNLLNSNSNCTDIEHMIQANIVKSIMEMHCEGMILESQLKCSVVDFFSDLDKVSTATQVQNDGAGVFLDMDSGDAVIEDFENISDWSEDSTYNNSSAGTMSQDGTYKTEGSYSIKLYHYNAKDSYYYGVKKDLGTSQDWSSSTFVKLKVRSLSSTADNIRIRLKDSLGNTWTSSSSSISTSFNQKSFDITSCTFLDDVRYIYIEIDIDSPDSESIYVDELVRTGGSIYFSSGSVESITRVTTSTDITHILLLEKVDTPADTTIVREISLDGGGNWHTINASTETKQWVDVSGWAEYGSFTNLKNLRIKYSLSTSDTAKTPTVDDYYIAYKVA